ncbi:MAG TPA: chemotaxis protein [Janthinobacterium sp.]|nr:chemotaxis protein [Janthinobacterium sp.]
MAALNAGFDSAQRVEALEIALLLEALLARFGFDFRGFEPAGLRRKLRALMRERGLGTISALQESVLHQPGAGAALLRALSVAPAAMFDDEQEARQLRQLLGGLRASAQPKIWLAECAGAEQAWTLAILLLEEGLLARTEIFASIANEQALAEARAAGIAPGRMAACAENYRRCGGAGRFADYFGLDEGRAVALPALRARITWAQYNLPSDASCNEFQLIVCRRALPDFGPALRRRALQTFHDSLARFGVLGLDRPLDADDALAARYRPVFPRQAWLKRVV